jgi:hypothetical protein
MSSDNEHDDDDEVAAINVNNEDDEDDDDEASADADAAPMEEDDVVSATGTNDNDIDNDDNETTATPVQEERSFAENGGSTPVPSEAASEAVVVAEDGEEDDEDEVLAAVVVEEGGGTSATATAESTSEKKRRRPGPKPKRKRLESDRRVAAKEAQAMLRHSVPKLPMALGESQIVRSFGRLYPEDRRFSNQHHIYPVGYSCDRYEFSPSHGRIIKLRCTILDGTKVRAKQQDLGLKVTAPKGPIFRIMWGGGIDDESEAPIEYPYDMDVYSAAVTSESNKSKSPPPPMKKTTLAPAEGMRVKVKYERDQWYNGTITDIDDDGQGQTEITIEYDDGSSEHASYPDPDITLCLPGESILSSQSYRTRPLSLPEFCYKLSATCLLSLMLCFTLLVAHTPPPHTLSLLQATKTKLSKMASLKFRK